jgi:hypothetical protein
VNAHDDVVTSASFEDRLGVRQHVHIFEYKVIWREHLCHDAVKIRIFQFQFSRGHDPTDQPAMHLEVPPHEDIGAGASLKGGLGICHNLQVAKQKLSGTKHPSHKSLYHGVLTV